MEKEIESELSVLPTYRMAQQFAGLASILHNMQMPAGVAPLVVK